MTTLTVTDRPLPIRARVVGETTSCLQNKLLAAASRIRCDFTEGMLILSGEVRTYRHKQLAQECMRDVAGVEQIVNHLQVVR